MNREDNLLTTTDMTAVDLNDCAYINNKGAKLYTQGTYSQCIEYYHLAAAMGDLNAISNLGYCYLYGREIKADLSLAISYFKIAAKRQSVDAAYKLGDIYGSKKWDVEDKELSVYYYRMAASFLIDDSWESTNAILYSDSLEEYPSLCFALGRELSAGGYMHTDIVSAYQFLKHAEFGYCRELRNGNGMYRKAYQGVLELLASEQFDEIRDRYDELFDDM